MAQSPSLLRFPRAESVYRALLRVYPSDYRHEYDELMAQLFRDLCRDAYRQGGRAGLMRLWQRVLVDTVITAAVEYIHTLEKGVHTMSKQQHGMILFWAGLPLGLGIILLLINPRFMLQLLAPNAAQPVGWLMTAAIVGLAVATYMIQRKVVLAAAADTSAGVTQNRPTQRGMSFLASILFLVIPALLLILLGPALITILLSGVFH
jgi:hypothetical protein